MSDLLRFMRPVRNDALADRTSDDCIEPLDYDPYQKLYELEEQMRFEDHSDFWYDDRYDPFGDLWDSYTSYDRYGLGDIDDEWDGRRIADDLYDAFDHSGEEHDFPEWLVENQMDEMFDAKEQAERQPPLCEHGYPEDDCDEFEGYEHLMEPLHTNFDHVLFEHRLERKGARAQRRRNTALRRRRRVALAEELRSTYRLRFELDVALTRGCPWKTYSMPLTELYRQPYDERSCQRDMLRMELDEAALDLATPGLLDY